MNKIRTIQPRTHPVELGFVIHHGRWKHGQTTFLAGISRG
jgi:hypothetical protein